MDDISIDRLIFDIPGLTLDQAEDLAMRVGEGLAAGAAVAGSFDNLIIDVHGHAVSMDVPRLANQIVASLLRQID